MNDLHLLFRFAAALAVGILIGLQRESEFEGRQKEMPAGIRTFALLGLTGAAAAMVADLTGSVLPLFAVLLVIGVFFSINHAQDVKRGRAGLTTKVASVLTLLSGALCYLNRVPLAVGMAVAGTFLLSFKPELHRFAHRITRADMDATLKFVVVSAVILPVLPNRSFGPEPFDVLNPFKIWLFVVFISGISYAGYILIKAAGPKKGIGLTGFLGGLVSSTALTASFTQRSRENQKLAKPFAFAVLIAWTVMFFRIMVIVAALNPGLLGRLWLPLIASMAAGLAYSAMLYRMEMREPDRKSVGFANPFELKSALKFAALFSAILLASKYTQVRFGSTGVLFSGFILGLADVDAVVLSMARLQAMDPGTTALAIVLAAAANTMLKAGIVAFGGSKALRKLVLPGFVLMAAAGLAAVFLL
jgi:uncharacterized membrane protein (DUF4010 family)